MNGESGPATGAKGPLSVAAARALVLAEAAPSGEEAVAIAECVGRVTAEAIVAAAPIPGFDNSAMDGYAVRSADPAGEPLRIVDESRAGHPARREVGPGEAARISTGAMMPAGADAVVPVEEAEERGDTVTATAGSVEPGRHVRRAGEDVRAGETVLPAGTPIGPSEVGVIANLGLATVPCARRPSLAVLTSGDELLSPGEPPAPGRIYDSNRFALVALAQAAGADAEHVASGLADDQAATERAIAAALEADFVVVSGGVSVGRHDHVKQALAALEVEQLFWRVALRPGGPTWAGVLRRPDGRPTLVFALPGNPVSALVTFRLFARPALFAATGRDPEERPLSARLTETYRKRGSRAHYLRCRLEPGPAGWEASLTRANQGSHVLSSMLGSDGLAVIPAERDEVAAGETVAVLPLLSCLGNT